MSRLSASSDKFSRAFSAAVAALERGQLPAARRQLEKALGVDPRHTGVLHHLGLVCQRLGKLGEASRYLQRAADESPGDPVVHNNLGNVLAASDRVEQALAAYSRAVSIRPDYVNGLYNLARTLLKIGRLDEGIEAYRRMIEIAPRDLEAHNQLGVALMDAGRHQEAGRAFKAALAIDPADAESLNNLGVFQMQMGEIEAARANFISATERDPGFARAYENLARSRRFDSKDLELVERLEKLIRDADGDSEDRMLFHFALGKILDDLSECERAFEHYRLGNEIKHASVAFDPNAHRAWVDRVIATFTPEIFESKRHLGSESALPVFIIGMIRSGTTLVEQIASSHPSVAGAGELIDMPELAKRLPAVLGVKTSFPECIDGLERDIVAAETDRYLARLRKVDDGAERVCDKLPTNFLLLGLIALLFPRARVIHCVRDPMDVCLSIYFQRFARGHEYAYDLKDIADYYRQYQRLMDHWRRVLPLEIHDLRYESLVENPEKFSRELIAFLGLEWNPACLNHDRTERVVSTASNWQVRQPVYRNSIQRWRRYERFLEPLKAELGTEGAGR